MIQDFSNLMDRVCAKYEDIDAVIATLEQHDTFPVTEDFVEYHVLKDPTIGNQIDLQNLDLAIEGLKENLQQLYDRGVEMVKKLTEYIVKFVKEIWGRLSGVAEKQKALTTKLEDLLSGNNSTEDEQQLDSKDDKEAKDKKEEPAEESFSLAELKDDIYKFKITAVPCDTIVKLADKYTIFLHDLQNKFSPKSLPTKIDSQHTQLFLSMVEHYTARYEYLFGFYVTEDGNIKKVDNKLPSTIKGRRVEPIKTEYKALPDLGYTPSNLKLFTHTVDKLLDYVQNDIQLNKSISLITKILAHVEKKATKEDLDKVHAINRFFTNYLRMLVAIKRTMFNYVNSTATTVKQEYISLLTSKRIKK